MGKKLSGWPNGGKVGIVVSQFNEFITTRLLQGCQDELLKTGLPAKDIVVLKVPGAFELPLAALKLAKKKNVVGVICLGAVIRGETIHFELVSECAARGIMKVSLKTEKPVLFAVITADTVNQAYARSEEKGCNRGREAVVALKNILQAFRSIKK